MRASEIRGLKWAQVDFLANSLTVGKSKTTAGAGRVIPLNTRAITVLSHWRGLFSGAEPEHYVFPHEKYGLAGNGRKQCAYEERYSHIRMEAKRKAVDTLSGADFEPGVAQNWAQFFGRKVR